MIAFELNRFYSVEELISLVRNRKERDLYYSVYAPAGEDTLVEGMSVFVGEQGDFDEHGNETFPDIVVQNNLNFCYLCEQFQDVVDVALKQKPSASMREIIDSLNFYADRDTFLELSPGV